MESHMKTPFALARTPPRLAARLLAMVAFAMLLAAAPFHSAWATKGSTPATPDSTLGTAQSFAVLGGPAITCTTSTIDGDVGVALPGGTVTNTGCVISGTTHEADTVALQAYNDMILAYDALGDELCTETLTGELGGVTLAPGVYCFDAAATFTGGQLTLAGAADDVWIFKIGAALTTTNFSVVMADGAQACNVYWLVGAAVTMTDSDFLGTILAGADITYTRGTLTGRLLAKGAVTVTDAVITGCTATTPPSVCSDRVTGGGWILSPTGTKASFAVSGGIKRGTLRGHLTYVDHGAKGSKANDMKVKGTGITVYTVVNATTRHIEGTAEINGVPGFTYSVDVADNGERGRNDTFSLTLSNGYTASGTLAGGNIQLHRKCYSSRHWGHDHDGKNNHDDDDDKDDHDKDYGRK